MVNSDISMKSPSCIRLTNEFGKGGSPPPNDIANRLAVGAGGILLVPGEPELTCPLSVC